MMVEVQFCSSGLRCTIVGRVAAHTIAMSSRAIGIATGRSADLSNADNVTQVGEILRQAQDDNLRVLNRANRETNKPLGQEPAPS